MSIGWGWKVLVLYAGFAVMIIMLVVASSRQKFDLVSDNYYQDEIRYQQVIDASRNQVGLSSQINVSAGENEVMIVFPQEFKDRAVVGDVRFYSTMDKNRDRSFMIKTSDNIMSISRSKLEPVDYILKVSYQVDGKDYYYETRVNLHK